MFNPDKFKKETAAPQQEDLYPETIALEDGDEIVRVSVGDLFRWDGPVEEYPLFKLSTIYKDPDNDFSTHFSFQTQKPDGTWEEENQSHMINEEQFKKLYLKHKIG